MQDAACQMILPYLPSSLRAAVVALPQATQCQLEELRLLPEQPLLLRLREGEMLLGEDGCCLPLSQLHRARRTTADELRKTLLLLAESSVYAWEEELRRGYITLPGGHRVGICGRAVLEAGHIRTIREVASINFRLARPAQDVALPLLPQLLDERKQMLSTLIISPPRAGKTTMLRDLARLLSSGINAAPQRVGIADERSELAALRQGQPQLAVGLRTDVMDGCSKAEAMLLLLRSMSPDVLVTDEIGRPEDALAIEEAAHAGVAVLASAHSKDEQEAAQRPVLAGLLQQGAFQRIVVLSRRKGPGTVEKICTADGKLLAAHVV